MIDPFAKCKVDMLHAFIRVRKFRKYIYPKKGTLDDAKHIVIDATTITPILLEMTHESIST